MPELIEDGPEIRALLLNEMDDGNVVFFCGGGVSMAEGSSLVSTHPPTDDESFFLAGADPALSLAPLTRSRPMTGGACSG